MFNLTRCLLAGLPSILLIATWHEDTEMRGGGALPVTSFWSGARFLLLRRASIFATHDEKRRKAIPLPFSAHERLGKVSVHEEVPKVMVQTVGSKAE